MRRQSLSVCLVKSRPKLKMKYVSIPLSFVAHNVLSDLGTERFWSAIFHLY
jgi:hypothetical protein